MSSTRGPVLPPRRTSTGPPPPPPRRSAPQSPSHDQSENESEIKPMGIAARIASLQLNQVGRSPMSPTTPTKPKPSLPARQPITPETEAEPEEEQEEEVEEEKAPPPPPPRRRSSYIPTKLLTWEEIQEGGGSEYTRLISRKPPPIPFHTATEDQAPPPAPPPTAPMRRLPPKPARLPTPPPEEEPEPEQEYDESAEEPPTSCIKCHDFTFVDAHAAQFPRESITSMAQLAIDLTSPWPSETEKVRALFVWMHHNIAYDAPNFLAGTVQPSTPESTLRSGLAVCDGYAHLFVALGQHAGLQVLRVGGHGKGYGYVDTEDGTPPPPYNGNHAWNCALMDGEWRLLDSCWGAGCLDTSTGTYQKRFAPECFTATNKEFGKKHFPEDPAYQLVPEEEGGVVTWEEYILDQEGPTIFTSFHEQQYSPHFLQPQSKYVQSGNWTSFHLFKTCEHMSTRDEDNYVAYIILPDQSKTPLTLDPESGGWCATVFVPAGAEGDIMMYYVREVSGQDAKGLGIRGYHASMGKKAMAFCGLCKWVVV